MEKSLQLTLDLESHRWLEKIQSAECDKFSYLKKRRKEVIAADVLRIGIAEYIKLHSLDIKL